jgi:hypothetical protein
MACCIVAALILAHLTALLRRWAVFWGLITPGEYDDPDTIVRRVRTWLRRPDIRRFARIAVAFELTALGLWAGIAHGEHLYRLGDQALGRMRGERVIYAAECNGTKQNLATRLVIAADGSVAVSSAYR